MRAARFFLAMTLGGAMLLAQSAVAQPTPRPFPRPSDPTQPPRTQPTPSPARPVAPVTSPAQPSTSETAPTEATLGVPIMPNARFITSYDAGLGQRYYLFGVAVPFVDVVNYYRTTLKQRGSIVFESPPTHMFEIGRFREGVMAFPPSVTIKDYTFDGSEGLVSTTPGAQPARFATVIQIVPAPGQ